MSQPFALSSNAAVQADPHEPEFGPRKLDEQRSSEAEVLQHMLEVESSRHRLERYAQELSRLAECSAKATLEAKQIAQRKSDLVVTISHEMKTPLNGILGMAHQLSSAGLDAEKQGYVEVIRQAGESLLALIDSMLDLAKMDAHKLQLNLASLPIRQVVGDALQVIKDAASRKELKLVSEIADDVPVSVVGDALRIRQILLNLLSNAVKFTSNGSIILRIETAPAAEGNQVLRFSVTDTGMGISPEGQARLFQRFNQADSSIASRFGGSGLGLAISKSLAELMGGSIGVVSQPGIGSSFWFTIQTGVSPVEPDLRSKSRVGDLPSIVDHNACGINLPQPRILLVDDNPINQKVALLFLKQLGYSATVVESGRKAVDEVSENKYDLILMDCQMPGMDGMQATRAIRQSLNGGRDTPIVAMTANGFVQDREACFASGMSDYLSKPLREQDLRNILERWLPGKPLVENPAPNANAPDGATLLSGSPTACEQVSPAKISACLPKLLKSERQRLVLSS